MERRTILVVTMAASVLLIANSCTDSLSPDVTGPPTPLTVISITPDALVPIAAQVSYSGGTADSIRAHYASTDNSDTGVTPWFSTASGSVPVLGLRASSSYDVTLESKSVGSSAMSSPSNYTTPALPGALAGVTLGLISGTPPASGYTLASLTGPDGHGYLVAFDGTGDIRWFRDFGKIDVQEAKQQTNGDFTVFVGNSIGDNPAVGAFVESYWTHDDKIDPPIADQSIDHPNSISFDLDGGVIVSYRNLGAIIKIDPSTRAVLWQMGGTRNQFRFINDPLNGFGGQHDVQVLQNGHFIVFDNGVTHTPQLSRAVEYAVDEPARTATMVWQYAPGPPLFNEFTGSVQRLSNGNTVIAWTNAGLVDEVSADGTLIDRMRLYNSPGVANTSAYRAIRIANLYRYATP